MPTSAPVVKEYAGNRARRKSVDWAALRDAFINRPERPTFIELATEYGIDENRLRKASSDEGWPALRAARLDAALRSSDAVTSLLDAARTEGTVQRAVSNIALELIAQLHEVMQAAAKAPKAENTRANTLNTVSFALRNLTGALKEVGIVGLPRALKNAPGMADEQGRWNPQMLAALNVTVQTIVGGAAATAPQGDGKAVPEPSEAPVEVETPAALPEPAGAVLEPVSAAPEREPVLARPADVI